MKFIRRFFRGMIVAITAMVIVTPVLGAVSNLPMADVGDFGNWATENNRARVTQQISNDFAVFEQNAQQLVDDYVPIEAKVGLRL